jgi:long-chain acyl-CoA synthetase
MRGYYEDPEATAAVLEGGWLRTGDVGRLDPDGFLFLCGRLKNVIIGKTGKNVYPPEVEAELARAEGVREVCVVGHRLPGDEAGAERVVALVVPEEELAEGTDPEAVAQQLRKALRERAAELADFKRPESFAIWPGELPRTTTLKFSLPAIRAGLDRCRFLPL